jgi:cyclase
MAIPRVIPSLLLRGEGLVKGINFKDYTYVGDPINAVKIFNEKEVDELLFLDILATREHRKISRDLVQKIADECYMPFGVGGGITTVEEIRDLLRAGAEKVCLNSAVLENPGLITAAARIFGSQSIVVSIDVKKGWTGGYTVYGQAGTAKTKREPVAWAQEAARLGAGEILLNSIDRDGTGAGYDLELLRQVAAAVSVPVIAAGGAGKLEHLAAAVYEGGAAAVAAGSFFVFHGRRRAVLINFPTKAELAQLFARGARA